MATGAAVIAVGGIILTIEGQKRAARAQAEAARANAESKRIAALELLDRFEINSQALRVEGELLKGQQKIGFAGRGIDVSTGSALNVIEETNSLVLRQLLLDKKEADFKAAQLFSGAEADVRLGGDILAAGRLQRAGTFLSGAGSVAASTSRGA